MNFSCNMEEKLKKLDTKKLIDVVKNYRQYGYDENLRNCAISILEERGITKEQLELSGNLVNKTYDHAVELYNAFHKNSITAFVLYCMVILNTILAQVLTVNFGVLAFYTSILSVGLLVLYLVFVVRSFMNQNRFYEEIGRGDGEARESASIMVLAVGAIVYFVMYFYFRNQMKEKIKEIK